MPRQSSGYTVTMTRSIRQPDWCRVELRKFWWSVDRGTDSRSVVSAVVARGGGSEAEFLADALGVLQAHIKALADSIA